MWVGPFLVWWFIASMMVIVMIAIPAERNPMGITGRIVKLLGGVPAPPTPELIKSPEDLFKQPNGVMIEDDRGLYLERIDGYWINSRGRRQNRIALPARIITD